MTLYAAENRPRIALTMGDVNGIGPEILAKALSYDVVHDACIPIVFGNRSTLHAAANLVGRNVLANLVVVDSYNKELAIKPGTVQADAGAAAVSWMQAAVGAALAGDVDAIVTCPINKEGIRLGGSAAIGHTEILAEMTNTCEYRMSLFSDRMRIVHITAHLPLADAVREVRADRIANTIQIAHDALTRLALPRRRIAVAGLNPHAGEGGMLGSEELREIEPAIRLCRERGIDCSGPYPPDTVFRRMYDGEFDLVVAMYHDQGHIPLKLIAMDEGVNVTLGIPVIRTSVDHGTAYDIAWKGIAREHSLLSAINLAAQLASSKAASAR